jgi:rSAM/selenodomain-associated transferase 1
VFARRPVPGSVKTRLSPAVPPALACDLHRAMLADTLAATAAVADVEHSIFWDRPATTKDGPPPGWIERQQAAGDLGARLGAAMEALLRSPSDRAVVIGTDAPGLGAATIGAALRALETHDVVLGPALDGGYYLIGLSRVSRAPFAGIAWGTARVLEQTRDAARRAGLTVLLLEPLADLDTPADLVRYLAARVAQGEAGTSRLDAALATTGLLPGPRRT